MHTRWIPATAIALLIPVCLAAQSDPGTDASGTSSHEPPLYDSRTANFESHVVSHGTTVWAGKSRNTIQKYADVKPGAGGTKTSHQTISQYEEDTLRREYK